MKRFLVFLISFLCLHSTVLAHISQEEYRGVYDALEPANFEYIFNLDPYQPDDYQKYIASPYPLLRSGTDFIFKDKTIPPGYYLLTPRKKDGAQYVLFKQDGKVKYIIPTYKTAIVDPLFYEQYIPTPKKTKWDKLSDFGNKFVSKTAKNSKRTPPPKAYIDINEIGDEFWEVILYYDNQKYFMIFERK